VGSGSGRVEVELVIADVERACALGVGATHLLEGEAGIGKTTTLEAVAGAAAALDVDVVRASAARLDRTRPFGPLLDALDVTPPVTAERQRRSPLQMVPEERAATIERLAAVLEERAATAPVLLTVDDLHWADPATLATLGRLHRSTAEHPLVVVGALRPLPRGPDLGELLPALRAADATVHHLAPLTEQEVAGLVAAIAGGAPGEGLLRVAARAGGNPFLVVELVRSLARDGRLTTTGDIVEVVDPGQIDVANGDARAWIADRMIDLDADAVHVLRIGATLGSTFALSDLAAVLGRTSAAVLPAIDTAIAAGLLADVGDRLGFRHDVVREVVVGTVSPSARAALHLDIARTLATTGAPKVRVAAHYALGAEPGDRTAVEWLRSAARDIVASAPTSAAELLEKALAVCPLADPEHDQILAELADAAFWGGDVERTSELARTALARPLAPAVAASLHETMARALVVSGRPGEAVAHAEGLLALGHQPAWATALKAVFSVFALDLDGAAAAARSAIELAVAHDDVWAETLAYCVLTWETSSRGFHEPAVELADRAVRAADRSPGGEAHRLLPHLFRGMSLESCGRTDEAEVTLHHGQQLADRLGTTWARPFYRYVLALPHWNAGRWDQCLAECEAGLREAREHDIGLTAAWASAIAASAHLFRNERKAAVELLDDGDRWLASGGVQFGADWLFRTRALVLESNGDLAGALALLRMAWDVADGLQAAAALVVLGPDLVRVAIEVRDVDTARRATEALERGEVGEERLNIDGHARRCRGMADLNVDALAEARAIHERCERPVEVVQDDEALVLVLARLGRIEEANAALDVCIAGCERLEMPFVAERVREAAVRHGIARSRRRARGTTGWEALTETERLVAVLVAAGRTNPQVAAELLISRRTVESHLYRIFFKLGVTNRTELAVVAMKAAPSST
jgi:DNA-binding NarL/FixJ family response regulator